MADRQEWIEFFRKRERGSLAPRDYPDRRFLALEEAHRQSSDDCACWGEIPDCCAEFRALLDSDIDEWAAVEADRMVAHEQSRELVCEQEAAVLAAVEQRGLEADVHGDDSRYVDVSDAEGDYLGTIRISDHSQPRRFGQRTGGVSLLSGERHDAASVSVAPGDDSMDDALALIERWASASE